MANARLQNIEVIDLTGTGNNTLVVSAREVMNLSSSNTLKVDGNTGDRLSFGAETWTRTTIAGGYATFTNGQATVLARIGIELPFKASPIELSAIAAGTGGFVLNGQSDSDRSGYSVASAGDVNGDGFDDLIVGAFVATPAGGSQAGKSYVVFGTGGGFAASIDLSTIAAGTGGFVINGQSAVDRSGFSVASAGDVDGDGFDDLIVGAYLADPAGGSNAGKSYVVFGKSGGFGASIDLSAIAAGTGGFVINGQGAGDFSGWSVASAGDVDGDGFDDFIIGAFGADPAAGSYAGKSYVVFGTGGGFGASIDLSAIAAGTGGFAINGQSAVDFSGWSVASAGDVNGDGFDDLIVGAPYADPAGRNYAGKSYVVFGKSGGFGASIALSTIAAGTGGFVINGQSASDQSGVSVAAAGDLDGDGFDDLIVGADRADPASGSNAGKSYTIFGQDFAAIVTHPGTSASETLTGTAGTDNIVAGLGNDTLDGKGGADALLGGGGNDTIRVSDLTFRRVDGGSGTDTLALDGAGITLDLPAIGNTRLRNIEVIDLTGVGNNTLKLSALEVLNLSSTTNTLKVDGNAGDSVSFSGETWTRTGSAGGYTTFVNGQATVLLSTAVSIITPAIDLSTIAAGTGGFVINGQNLYDRSGISVASAGDINGDGFDDLIIGANYANTPSLTYAGKSYVVFGKSGGFGATVELSAIAAGTGGFVLNGQASLDYAGTSVASAGDLDGDGLDDLIVGAHRADPPSGSGAGKSYVVFGKTGAFDASIELSAVAAGSGGFVINGQSADDASGRSVASAGDVNGDGFADLIVGAEGADPSGQANAGKSYVVFGGGGGFGASIDLSAIAAGTGGFVISGQAAGDLSGTSVASAGDINGDGVADLIVGAYGAAPSGLGLAGKSYVVFGRTGTFGAGIELSAIAAGSGGFVINGQAANELSGRSVASAGDVNGDGVADLIVGAYGAAPSGLSFAGKSYVVFGKTGAFGASVDLSAIAAGTGGFVINGQAATDLSGRSVASAGDVNGDGFDDVIIGAAGADPAGGSAAGKSYVVFGRAGGVGASIDLSAVATGAGGFVINGQSGLDYAGRSVAAAGDIDGDGFDDLIVGASGADPAGQSYAGKSYVIFGRDFNLATTQLGSTASETLTGTTGADDIVAGLGNDILDGKGGVDVLLGGGGNDTIKVADTAFRRVDGGAGTDTLALDGAGITLNLTAIPDTRLQDIEVIDLTGAGNNTLVLSRLEVLNLSSTTNTLKVDGNAGDIVDLSGGGWARTGSAGGYTTFVNGQATVLVKSEVAFRVTTLPIELSTIAAGTGGFVINGQSAFDFFGGSVASAGDINGDGFDDLIIGAFRADPAGRNDAGKSYVVFGKSGGFGAIVDLSAIEAGTGGFVLNGQSAIDRLGFSVASAGDVNGDGLDDVVVGAYGAAPAGQSFAGKTYVVFGKTGTFGASVDLSAVAAGTGGYVLNGQSPNDVSGRSVASAGDVNGDGFVDLIVGANRADLPGRTDAGKSYVVFGKAGSAGASTNLSAIAAGSGGFVINGQTAGDLSGTSVASAGDINGDGVGDLIVGAEGADPAGGSNAGKSYVVFGRTGAFSASVELSAIAAGTGGFVINGQATFDLSGRSVASAGDVNGDGIADLIIGAYRGDPAFGSDAGKSYVVFGKTGAFSASVDLSAIAAGTGGFVINGQAAGDVSGRSVASAGDVNGDGFDDLIIGAYAASPPGRATAGKSYVVFGRAAGGGAGVDLSAIAAGTGGFVINGEAAGDFSGHSVAAAGDIDGDGFDDLIVGAVGASPPGQSYAGKSYVIFGRDFSLAATQFGSTASETLTGSSDIDDIVAGLGNDLLDGKGGLDVLIGGGGNDTIKVADTTFRRVDGGAGTDTLALDGAGITLNLAAIPDARLQDIEVIDLTGAGNNTLVLSRLEVLNLSSTTNTLKVDGNAGDIVDLGAEAWSKSGPSGGYVTFSNGQATVLVDQDVTIACFAAGTRIGTDTGDVAVEALRIGDAVRLASGGLRPIRWIGWRRLDLERHPQPRLARPIRIQAGAFADGMPARDLRVSPDHALFVDGVLIPARMLVNRMTITEEATCRSVTYYHIELDAHDILLAEGLPAESYLDTGNRGLFENAGLPLTLHPDLSGQAGREALSCAPFASSPELVKPVWDRLAARAVETGMAAVERRVTSDPDLRIEAAGRILRPIETDGDRHVFVLPAGCEAVRLLSRASIPADIAPWHEDRRRLGVSVRRISVREGAARRELPLDHPGLRSGWWGVERHGQAIVRWTDGDAAIPVGALGGRLLEITAGRLDAYLEEAEAVGAAGAVPLTAGRSIESWHRAYG